MSSVYAAVLTPSAGDDIALLAQALAGADTFRLSEQADFVRGFGGNDALAGGAGADRFVFASALDGAANVDRITDLAAGEDRFELDDAVFVAAGPVGPLAPEAFRVGPAATDTSHRVVYDDVTGQLCYDADGLGGVDAVQFAVVATGTPLTADVFWIA